MRKYLVSLIVLLLTINITAQHRKRELRAAWIATVSNIDWPSQTALTSEEQQAELIAILDLYERNNMNALIFQIRPTADALYQSTLEPWSHWLTGKQGFAPEPYYDPLSFLITEAHKRCIDVHVWLNPYRVTTGFDTARLAPNHIFRQQPELFVKYNKQWYFDPGYDETRAYLNKLVADVVTRYDIDAVHFDDYFYPYKVGGLDFGDTRSFMLNQRGYSVAQKDDWRRNNVDMIIAELQQTIKAIKPWVEFGISPFGVWRNQSADPRGSATRAGVQNYDDLYADILKWLREGTIDYVMPQLYWEVGLVAADYEILCKWWSENAYNKNLYIGMAGYKLGLQSSGKAWHRPNELVRQLRLNKYHREIDGVAFYSTKSLMNNAQGINDSLQNELFKYIALPPMNRNIKGVAALPPLRLRTVKQDKQTYLVWEAPQASSEHDTSYYVVYAFKGRKMGDTNDPRHIIARTTNKFLHLDELFPEAKGVYTFVVTSVNRYKYESIPSEEISKRL